MRRSRRSTCASASSFSMSWRASSRSTASPVTRNSPSPSARPRTRPAAGRKTAMLGQRVARAAARPATGSATGTRRSSSTASSSSPSPVALRGDEHRHRRAAARATPRPRRRRRRAARGRPSRARARAAARPAARRARPARARSSRGSRRGSEPSSGARSSTWTSSRVRSTWARKSWPSPAPLAGALDQPRDVGDHELALGGLERAEHRLERRERVVGDLRRGARQARDQRRLAGVGQPDEPDVGEQLELQLDQPSSPGRPRSASRGAWRVAVVKRLLPRPPPPPRATRRLPGHDEVVACAVPARDLRARAARGRRAAPRRRRGVSAPSPCPPRSAR